MNNESLVAVRQRTLSPTVGWAIVVLIAVVGLAYAKWLPYYHESFAAYATRSVGASILTGRASQPPPASFRSALDYGLSYGRAI